LDISGHDTCRLNKSDTGLKIEGTAVYFENGKGTKLDYQVECDSKWITQRGFVSGWIGENSVDFAIFRTSGGQWALNDDNIPGLENCVDLDFGFTPATNLLQLRRTDMQVGQVVDLPVAWFDVFAGKLELLDQHYEKRGTEIYWYEAPRFSYSALLEVTPIGFIRLYPGLWEMEA
jgi:hypothetical protein